jgi:hypothetical protein
MRPTMVVIVAPRFDGCARLGQTQEYMLVEAFVAQAAVERFHECTARSFAVKMSSKPSLPQSRRSVQLVLTGNMVVRTHLSLEKDAPEFRRRHKLGPIATIPILGGLHHQYVRI